MDHAHVRLVLGADVGDLVVLEGDLHLHGVRGGLHFVGFAVGLAGIGIQLVHDEGEVVQQGVDPGVLLLGVGVQGLHVSVVAAAIRDGRHDQARGVGHGVAPRQRHLDVDAGVVLVLIETLVVDDFVLHNQLRVRRERGGRVANRAEPGAVLSRIGQLVQPGLGAVAFNLAGFNIFVAFDCHRSRGLQVVGPLIQRFVDIIRDRGQHAVDVVAGRVGHRHVGVVGTRIHGHRGQERVLALERRHADQVVAGLAGRPFKRAVRRFAAGNHGAVVRFNGKFHPLGAGGIVFKVNGFVDEHRGGIGCQTIEAEHLFFLGLFLLSRFALDRLFPGGSCGGFALNRIAGVALLGSRRRAFALIGSGIRTFIPVRGLRGGVLLRGSSGLVLTGIRIRFGVAFGYILIPRPVAGIILRGSGRFIRSGAGITIVDRSLVFGVIPGFSLLLLFQTIVCFGWFRRIARVFGGVRRSLITLRRFVLASVAAGRSLRGF